MRLQSNSIKELTVISLFIAMSLVLSYVENFIPIRLFFAFPGIKLGLANIISLISLGLIAKKKIYLMVFVRVVMAALFIGSVVSFWYSLFGALFSLSAMLLLYSFKGKFSLVGISAVGGIFHNIGQLIVLAIITNRLSISIVLAPKLLLAGMITGIFIGYVAKYIKPVLCKNLDIDKALGD